MFSKKEMAAFNALYYLYAISINHSKREVAELLGTSVDTINKYISDLEYELGVTLLSSNGRGTALTPEGIFYVKAAERIVNTLRNIKTGEKHSPADTQTIKISMPDTVSCDFGEKNIKTFMEKFPGINIVTEIEDCPDAKADICLSLERPKDSGWINIAEKNISCGLYASRLYLKKYGMPKDYGDLIKGHRICSKNSNENFIPGWGEVLRTSPLSVLQHNSVFANYSAIKNGIGIGICSQNYASNDLVKIKTVTNFDTTYKIYLSARKDVLDTPQIKAFLEFSKGFFNSGKSIAGCPGGKNAKIDNGL